MRKLSIPKLTAADLRLLRLALSEAIDNVIIIEDSNLPPLRRNYNKRERKLRVMWDERIAAWKKLRKKLGGNLPGEDIAAQELEDC